MYVLWDMLCPFTFWGLIFHVGGVLADDLIPLLSSQKNLKKVNRILEASGAHHTFRNQDTRWAS